MSRRKESAVDEVKLVVVREEIFDVLLGPQRITAWLNVTEQHEFESF